MRTAIAVVLALVGLLTLSGTAFAQTATPSATPTAAATATATATATPAPSPSVTPTPGPGLTLTPSQGAPGSTVTVKGSGFQPGETVQVTFNGNPAGSAQANTDRSFSADVTVPNLAPGDYTIAAEGQTSGLTASATYKINQSGAGLNLSATQGIVGQSITVNASGFEPGETVEVQFNRATVGTGTVDTTGAINVAFAVPNLAPGQYAVAARGQTSGVSASGQFTIVAATPTATPSPAGTPTAGPTATPPPAPPVQHDDRYFGQTGYRVDSDQIWSFFQTYGGIQTFGYPTSRNTTFLGCPVQFFQRQIIQVCPNLGPALINLLDPEIFPYTQVNGSTFPAPDNGIKANTPQVSDPNYSTDILAFVQRTVPDQYGGQPVSFFQYFNSQGGLTIWGAPISNPQPDPSNANFIYQRFQRGIMHYIAGTGTESILLADYLKAIMLNQNVPPDLLAQSRNSRYFQQYCPAAQLWLCRPNDLPGTDLTFAFERG
jgi:hypothetical protein